MGRYDEKYVDDLEVELEKLKAILVEVKRIVNIVALDDEEWRREGAPSTDTLVQMVRKEVEKAP